MSDHHALMCRVCGKDWFAAWQNGDRGNALITWWTRRESDLLAVVDLGLRCGRVDCRWTVDDCMQLDHPLKWWVGLTPRQDDPFEMGAFNQLVGLLWNYRWPPHLQQRLAQIAHLSALLGEPQ